MMQTVRRRELKYHINYADYIKLSLALREVMLSDKYSDGGGYFIRSVYFDNIFETAFFDKLEGIEKRKKYRLRLYNTDDKFVKFEIKHKLNQSILKESTLLPREDAVSLLQGDYEVLLKRNNPLLYKTYCEFKKNSYRPVVLIDYEREAFTWPINNIRITFDTGLRQNTVNFDMFQKDLFTTPVPLFSDVILEIKFEHMVPEWITALFSSISFVNSSISKYCLSRMEVGI